MTGWIKLYRSIKNHWLWNSGKLQWWIDILLTVNHADSKVLIGGEFNVCNRGQSIRSLETWARDWGVTKKTVRTFFKLLQKDDMILYESLQFSTRITVCNYDTYQDMTNEKDPTSKQEGYREETEDIPKQECKNDNNAKNGTMENKPFIEELKRPKVDYQLIVGIYHQLCPSLNKVIVINNPRKKSINDRVKEHGLDKVISVIREAGESDFLNGVNDKGWKADFDWILKPASFINIMEGKYKNKIKENQFISVFGKAEVDLNNIK